MPIVTISRIQHRKGLHDQLPQLASAELGWATDRRRLYIGNGTIPEGAPELGNTEILTEYSDVLGLANQYTFKNSDSGYTPVTRANSSQYNAVTYGNGKYVAVGANGQTVISTDAITWSNTDSGTINSLLGVTYAFGYYIAVGVNGTVVISASGTAWQTIVINSTVTLTSVEYINSLVMATGNDGNVYKTTDAINWTLVATGNAIQLNGVSYGNSKYVAVGQAGTVIYSTNGITWTTETISTFDIMAVTYQNSKFIATGQNTKTWYSTDGVSWIRSLVDAFVASAVDAGNVSYFLTSWGDLYNDANGDVEFLLNIANDQTFTDMYLDTANGFFVVVTQSGKIYNSTNGSTFNLVDSGNPALYGIYQDSTSGSPKWLVCGATGTLLTSTDGTTWTAQTTGTTETLYDVTIFSTSTYVVVGSNGTILTSPNAVTWTDVPTGLTQDLYNISGHVVAPSDYEVIIAGEAGHVLNSTDGTNFNVVLAGSVNVNAVVVQLGNIHHSEWVSWVSPSLTNRSSYVFTGDDGMVLVTDDLTNWTLASSDTTVHLTSLVYNGSKFKFCGDGGITVLESTDLINFIGSSIRFANNVTVPDCMAISTNSVYNLIAGQFGQIYGSTGTDFYKTLASVSYDVMALVYGSVNLAVGKHGLVATSTDAITWNDATYTYGNTITERSLQQKLDDFVSVKDFGARGDGVTDDTVAINLALNELYVRFTNPGTRKILHFPAGTYVVSDSINVPHGAYLQGEGMDNTILAQTRPASLNPQVSWLIYSADSLQQISGNLGLNGAVLPGNMRISDMTLRSPSDCVIIDKATDVSFRNVKFQGTDASNTRKLNDVIMDRPVSGVRFVGTGLVPARDITFYDCEFTGTNCGLYVAGDQNVDGVNLQSCNINTLYQGMRSVFGAGTTKQFSISNSMFDLIYSSACEVSNADTFISSFNSYREAGNHLLGDNYPYDVIVNFAAGCVNCASIADSFKRSYASSLTVDRVSQTVASSDWYFGRGIRLGAYQMQNGKSAVLTDATAKGYLVSGLDIQFTSAFAIEMFYTISRKSQIKSGYFKLSTNGTNYFFDDDSNQTGNTGTTLGFDGTDIYFTTDSSGDTGLINYAIRYLEML